MSKLISENDIFLHQLESTKSAFQKISGLVENLPHPLSEPHCPIDVLMKFKKVVVSAIGIEVIRTALDFNFSSQLSSLLLRRFWLGKEREIKQFDRQLIQNQICTSFYDVFYYIDSSRPETDVLHHASSNDITRAIKAITGQQSQKQKVRSFLHWFGYELTSVYKCEPNIYNQLRVSLKLVEQKGERRFHIASYKNNYEIYGAWRLRAGSKPSFELIELINSFIGYENLHLHKIQEDIKLKKTASLLRQFWRMVRKAGGEELLLSNQPEMIDFVSRPHIKDVVTPGMFVY